MRTCMPAPGICPVRTHGEVCLESVILRDFHHGPHTDLLRSQAPSRHQTRFLRSTSPWACKHHACVLGSVCACDSLASIEYSPGGGDENFIQQHGVTPNAQHAGLHLDRWGKRVRPFPFCWVCKGHYQLAKYTHTHRDVEGQRVLFVLLPTVRWIAWMHTKHTYTYINNPELLTLLIWSDSVVELFRKCVLARRRKHVVPVIFCTIIGFGANEVVRRTRSLLRGRTVTHCT